MLLGKTLNVNDVELLERERIALGLGPREIMTSDVVDNVTISNERRSLLIKSCVEHGLVSHNCNESKAKVKEDPIAVHNSLTENTLKE